MTEEINQRNDPLLSMLKDVYVESKDPQVRNLDPHKDVDGDIDTFVPQNKP